MEISRFERLSNPISPRFLLLFLTLHLKQTFSSIIWIFTEGEGDGIKSRLPFKIFSIYLFLWQIFHNNVISYVHLHQRIWILSSHTCMCKKMSKFHQEWQQRKLKASGFCPGRNWWLQNPALPDRTNIHKWLELCNFFHHDLKKSNFKSLDKFGQFLKDFCPSL